MVGGTPCLLTVVRMLCTLITGLWKPTGSYSGKFLSLQAPGTIGEYIGLLSLPALFHHLGGMMYRSHSSLSLPAISPCLSLVFQGWLWQPHKSPRPVHIPAIPRGLCWAQYLAVQPDLQPFSLGFFTKICGCSQQALGPSLRGVCASAALKMAPS